VYYTNGIAGIAYDLVATQLLVPVWYDGGDVGGADFEPVEDGYVASADEQQEF